MRINGQILVAGTTCQFLLCLECNLPVCTSNPITSHNPTQKKIGSYWQKYQQLPNNKIYYPITNLAFATILATVNPNSSINTSAGADSPKWSNPKA